MTVKPVFNDGFACSRHDSVLAESSALYHSGIAKPSNSGAGVKAGMSALPGGR